MEDFGCALVPYQTGVVLVLVWLPFRLWFALPSVVVELEEKASFSSRGDVYVAYIHIQKRGAIHSVRLCFRTFCLRK